MCSWWFGDKVQFVSAIINTQWSLNRWCWLSVNYHYIRIIVCVWSFVLYFLVCLSCWVRIKVITILPLLSGIIIIMDTPVSAKFDAHGAWALLPLSSGQLYHSKNHLNSLGEYAAHAAKCVAQRANNQTRLPSLPSQVPIYTPGWREAIIVKCLAQGHKHHGHGQDSNPHSDDLAIRTQVRCTRPLGHGTPWNI